MHPFYGKHIVILNHINTAFIFTYYIICFTKIVPYIIYLCHIIIHFSLTLLWPYFSIVLVKTSCPDQVMLHSKYTTMDYCRFCVSVLHLIYFTLCSTGISIGYYQITFCLSFTFFTIGNQWLFLISIPLYNWSLVFWTQSSFHAVSYTLLDVYKRQAYMCLKMTELCGPS